MSHYQTILDKINQFIRKYYVNELIRGIILFLTLGLLYFLATLYIEYFLWLKPKHRTLLFALFVGVELFLLYRYILIPLLKIIGLRKGIDKVKAAQIIGKFFPEIDDKLLNTIQLYDQTSESDLVLSSVEQKSQDLQIFPFKKAVNFKVNTKYLKYLTIPVLVYLMTLLSGKLTDLNKSYERLTHPKVAYIPPAPFSFHILNENLKVIEGQDFTLKLFIEGNTVPDEVYITDNGNRFFMQKQTLSEFSYTFKNVNKPHIISLQSGTVSLNDLQLEVIHTPKIKQFEMVLNYPSHTGKRARVIKNTGNAFVPEGTVITWRVTTSSVDSLFLLTDTKRTPFKNTEAEFSKSLNIRQSMDYAITASNEHLTDYERLNFSVRVIKDEYPKIVVQSDIDSITHGEAHFAGRVSDDYGLHRLNLVYYKTAQPNDVQVKNISIKKTNIDDFIFTFPGELNLEDSHQYSLYFEVFDNDVVNGLKSVKSKVFSYYKPSTVELEQLLLEEQDKNLQNLDDHLKKQSENQKQLNDLEQQLKNSPEMDYSMEQELKEAIEKHEKYNAMMQEKLNELNERFEEQNLDNNQLEEKKNDIKQRLQETLENEKFSKLMEELKALSEKLDKEELLKKMQEMSSHSKYREKSLKELLELTKRFYVEQELQHITEALDDLSKKQEALKNQPDNSVEQQQKQSEEFKNLQHKIEKMLQDNQSLQKPMTIDPQKSEQRQINEEQQQAEEQLKQQQKKAAESSQSKAAQKMKQMSQAFQQQLQAMQQESIQEDISSIKRLLDNLLIFSFKQEDLLTKLGVNTNQEFNFSNILKEQYTLQTYFEHIDDSLYTLSMRQPKLSKDINTYLEKAHYNLKSSINTLEDNNLSVARSHQQFVMTSANDIAYLLNNLLDNLNNSLSMGSGQGSPMQSPGFSLPDIIKKQESLSQSMQMKLDQEGDKEQTGTSDKKSKQSSEQHSGDIYEIYKQQAQIRQQLEQQLENLKGTDIEESTKRLLRQMEQLENMLLEKGITQEAIRRMNAFEHELLKLKNATYNQQEDQKRTSKTRKTEHQSSADEFYKTFIKNTTKQEILNREPLPFQSDINVKINNYFKTETISP